MGQVPINTPELCFGVIGDGGVARHFSHYLSYKSCNVVRYKRNDPHFKDFCLQSDVILIAVSDSSIQTVFEEIGLCLGKKHLKTLIHFSGSLMFEGIFSMHPLMTFPKNNLYDVETYEKISFVGIEEEKFDFKKYFPFLKNNFYTIKRDLKSYYHSLAVVGGNFSTLLMKEMIREMRSSLELPLDIGELYLKKIVGNLNNDLDKALTGPLARNDLKTIESNLNALKKHNIKLEKIYLSFLEFYKDANS